MAGRGQGEAARVFITVGLDAQKAVTGLRSTGDAVQAMAGRVNNYSKTIQSAFEPSLRAFERFGEIGDGMRMAGQAVAGLAETLLGGAARNEQYAVSFEVLLGSADKAREHIAALTQFANTTPFTLPGIVESSKQLEVMGGAALNSLDNLRMVGDVASGTGTDIERVAVQFGRLYDGLKNGTPLGEVMMRLGEMGAISGESRRKIMALGEAVQDGAMTMEDAWAAARKEFSRFAGQTNKQAQTLAGMWSTFTDTVDHSLAQLGNKLLPVVKPALKSLTELVGKLGEAALWMVDNIELVAPVMVMVAVPAVLALAAAVWGLAQGVIAATWPFVAIGLAIGLVIAILQKMFPEVDVINAIVTLLANTLKLAVAPLVALGQALGWLGEQFGLIAPQAQTMSTETQEAVNGLRNKVRGELEGEGISAAAADFFKPIPIEASRSAEAAKTTIRLATRTVIDTIKGARDVLNGVASEAAAALYDPLILEADIALTKLALKDKELLAQTRSANAEEAAEGRKRRAELQKNLFTMLTEWTTYGTESQQRSRVAGLLASEEYAQMLRDGTPEQVAALGLWQTEMQKKYNLLTHDANTGGKRAGTALGTGFRVALPTTSTAYSWGTGLGQATADGLAAMRYYMTKAAQTYMSGARGQMEFNSPAKEGPFRYIDDWGRRAGATFADNLAAMSGYLSAATSDFMRGGMPALAQAPSGGSPAAMAPAGGMGGGGLSLTIENHSAVPYTPAEMDEMGRRVGPAVYEYLRTRGVVSG